MKCYKWPYGTMDKVSAYGAGDSGTSPAGPFLLMQSAATSPRGSDCRARRARERKRRPISRSNAIHSSACTRKILTEKIVRFRNAAMRGWCNGSASASKSEGWELEPILPSLWLASFVAPWNWDPMQKSIRACCAQTT